MYTEQLSQSLGVVGLVIPGTAATGSSLATDPIDISSVRRVLFSLLQGGAATSGASQILVRGATASGGAYTTISQLSSNVLTASGVAMSEATMEGIVSLGLGYTWLKGVVNITGANLSGTALLVQAGDARNGPASNLNADFALTPVVF